MFIAHLIKRIRLWLQHRSDRRVLTSFDERTLQDLGVTRADLLLAFGMRPRR